ncbi:MAG: DUF58 domain-containing protein, partial [Planctomycetes bacterium]|nr:DUF58 domain-containing protein [Planctomycetota bacterium]
WGKRPSSPWIKSFWLRAGGTHRAGGAMGPRDLFVANARRILLIRLRFAPRSRAKSLALASEALYPRAASHPSNRPDRRHGPRARPRAARSTGSPPRTSPFQMTVEAGWGLGEGIVNGQVATDSYVVEKGTFRILSRVVRYKLRAYMPGDDYRTINWQATAKRMNPVTEHFRPERARPGDRDPPLRP